MTNVHLQIFRESKTVRDFVDSVLSIGNTEHLGHIDPANLPVPTMMAYLEWQVMKSWEGADRQPMFYIAHHYTAQDNKTLTERAKRVREFCSILLDYEFCWFSPICHSHEVSQESGRDGERDARVFIPIDLQVMKVCDAMIHLVTSDHSWFDSSGLCKEYEAMLLSRRPVFQVQFTPTIESN